MASGTRVTIHALDVELLKALDERRTSELSTGWTPAQEIEEKRPREYSARLEELSTAARWAIFQGKPARGPLLDLASYALALAEALPE